MAEGSVWPTRALLLVALGLTGCAPLTPRPVWRAPESEVRERARVICLLAPRTQVTLPDQAAKLSAVADQISHRLAEAGFRVVAADPVTEVFRRTVTSQGGYYDPHTGERDRARYDTIRAQALSALHTELGCDATLLPTVALVSVPFYSGVARWDGVSYPYGGLGTNGWTSGLSLWVSLHGIDDRDLYFGTGGIEPIFNLSSGLFSDAFSAVSDDRILTDQTRMLQAINTALGPLLAAGPTH